MGDGVAEVDRPEILIIAPKGENHTFGAQMIARKFKRLGTSPYLSINNTIEEIVNIISKQKFVLIGLSITGQKVCEKNSDFMKALKVIKKWKIPIVAGGNLVSSSASIIKCLNIDLITNDAAHALNYFNINLSIQKRDSKPLAV